MSNIFFFFSGMYLNDFLERSIKDFLRKELEFHEPGMGGKCFYEKNSFLPGK